MRTVVVVIVMVVVVVHYTTATTRESKLIHAPPRHFKPQTDAGDADLWKESKITSWNALPPKEKKGKEVLGRTCAVSQDCKGIPGAVCDKGKCLCKPHYLALNATHCLPGVLLGFRCEVDRQCGMRVPHSSCIQGYCRCGHGFVPYWRNNCLKAAKVGGVCRNHEQCREGTRGTFCKYTVPRIIGRCACSHHLPIRRGDTCSHLGYRLGFPCGNTAQCSRHIPGSICIQAQNIQTPQGKSTPVRITAIPGVTPRPLGFPPAVCGCPPGHLEAENGTRCIPVLKDIGVTPSSLGQPCESSEQCQASDPFSYCHNAVCHCRHDTHTCSARNPGCHPKTFQCHGSGRCISWYFLCDGKRHCDDGSDEAACIPHRCPRLAHTCNDGTCLSKAKLCDGKTDCPDGSDEERCDGDCPASAFRCKNGRCLPGFVFCNATPSCDDGSDEIKEACVQGAITTSYCPFRCKNGRCRSTAILCSGKDGCGDNSDEEQCTVCSCAPNPT